MDDGVDFARDGGIMTPRWVGLVLFAVLIAHAVFAKLPYGLLFEMFWACHVATAIAALGVLLQKRELIVVGFSFHLGAGCWGYLIDLIATCTTTWTSVLVHVAPLSVGYVEVRRSGLPRWAPWASFAFLSTMVVFAYFFTPPDLNVNLAHRAWPPVARLTSALWVTWATNLCFGFFLMMTTDWLARKWLGRTGCVEFGS